MTYDDAPMTTEQFARNLCARMREIAQQLFNGGDEQIPDADDFNLLWDACVDEILAACPKLDVPSLLILEETQ